MDSIANRLSLSVRLVIEWLLNTHTISNVKEFKSESDGLIRVTTDQKSLNIVGYELDKGESSLISIVNGSLRPVSCVLRYNDNLKIPSTLQFPVSFQKYVEMHDIKDALQFIGDSLTGLQPFEEKHRQPEKIGTETQGQPDIDVTTRNNDTGGPRKPKDMPDFDDEYEVRGTGSHMSGTAYPGLNVRPHAGGDVPSYGNPDLYPMGKKDPFNFNDINARGTMDIGGPRRNNPGGGNGMIMDPFANRNQSNMQGDPEDLNARGPGWIPGSKYDDPFGRINRPNMGGGPPGFPGGGFGPSGFI